MKEFLARNKVSIIVLALIGSQLALIGIQLLTWQAVRSAVREVEWVQSQLSRNACGSGPYNDPCRVVIVQR